MKSRFSILLSITLVMAAMMFPLFAHFLGSSDAGYAAAYLLSGVSFFAGMAVAILWCKPSRSRRFLIFFGSYLIFMVFSFALLWFFRSEGDGIRGKTALGDIDLKCLQEQLEATMDDADQ